MIFISIIFFLITIIQSEFVDTNQFLINDADYLNDLIYYQNDTNNLSEPNYYLLFNYKNSSAIQVYDQNMELISPDFITTNQEISAMLIYNNYLIYTIDNNIYFIDLINGNKLKYTIKKMQHIDTLYENNNIIYALDQQTGTIINNEEQKVEFNPNLYTTFYENNLVTYNNKTIKFYDLKTQQLVQSIPFLTPYSVDKLKFTDEYLIALIDNQVYYRSINSEGKLSRLGKKTLAIENLFISNNQIYSLINNKPYIIHYQERKEL